MAMVGNLHQGNILSKVVCEVFFGPLDGREVIFLQSGMNLGIRLVVGVAGQHPVNDFHHAVVDLQFTTSVGQYQAEDMGMQKFRFCRGLD